MLYGRAVDESCKTVYNQYWPTAIRSSSRICLCNHLPFCNTFQPVNQRTDFATGFIKRKISDCNLQCSYDVHWLVQKPCLSICASYGALVLAHSRATRFWMSQGSPGTCTHCHHGKSPEASSICHEQDLASCGCSATQSPSSAAPLTSCLERAQRFVP